MSQATPEPVGFRDYEAPARDTVRDFYRLNHRHQTLAFARARAADFLRLNRREMSTWEAMEYLDTLVDDSDPDTESSQLAHLLQSAEAARRDGQPDWMVLTALIHDLGKVLCLFGEPQWAVVGDTFPLGCAFSPAVIYHEFFASNPDNRVPDYQSACGIYAPGCGLGAVTMSWGHDEYLFHVVRDYLPEPALYCIRYHSFYAQHRDRAYEHLLNDHDRAMFEHVRAFNSYDLYSKADEPPDVALLRPTYQALIDRLLPPHLRW